MTHLPPVSAVAGKDSAIKHDATTDANIARKINDVVPAASDAAH